MKSKLSEIVLPAPLHGLLLVDNVGVGNVDIPILQIKKKLNRTT